MEAFQSVEDIEVLGGDWSRENLDRIARNTGEVSLLVDHEPSGLVRNVRRVGARLLADLAGVPAPLARRIRAGQFARIGTAVYSHLTKGLRDVLLLTAPAAKDYGSHSYDAIRTYTFDRLTFSGAACAQEYEESEMGRFEQTDAVRPEDIDAEVVARVRAYQGQDPSFSFEAAYRQLSHRDPDLWRLYGEKTLATVGTVADSPAEQRAAADWHEAGLEVLREADQYQQASPELSREQAIHAVLRDNAELTRRYARGSTPPGA